MNGERSVPTGVKVIAVLDYIGASLLCLFGILFTILGVISLFNPSAFLNTQNLPLEAIGPLFAFMGAFALIGGIILIGLSVFVFFIARGLWKGRNWARIITIIFSGLWSLVAIISMIQGNIASNILNLAVNLLIGGYLLFSTKVKEVFA